ncbi:MAG: GTPase ObgE [Alphaproteobacteria bacterium]|nr:GTPase ObgE [Alphaproteobacteria bacterium]
MKFLDEAKILIGSGNGGKGCVGFHREKYIEFGGPDGGNGGKGGSLYFEAVNDLNTLIDFRYAQHFRAKPGQGGMGRNKSGAKGEDLVVKVPVGTQIIDEDGETVLMDMMEPEKMILFLKGGDGGFGNAHYKSATNQAPRNSTPGWDGEERLVWLRLKLIADVGLVGMPNAGKSTFLSVVSAAKPKVADYPFTTLHPNLGVVRAGDREFVVADIPGLIEGASEGLGLGHKFLAHVERTSALLHLIDITQDDPAGAYRTIRTELEKYGDIIADRPEIVALTKSDSLGDELSADQARIFEEETGIKPFVFSCLSGEGVKSVLFALHDEVYKTETDETFVLNLHKK